MLVDKQDLRNLRVEKLTAKKRKAVTTALLRWRIILMQYDFLVRVANGRSNLGRDAARKLRGVLESAIYGYVRDPKISRLEAALGTSPFVTAWLVPNAAKQFLSRWLAAGCKSITMSPGGSDRIDLEHFATLLGVSPAAVLNILEDEEFGTNVTPIERKRRTASAVLADAFLDALGYPGRRTRIRSKKEVRADAARTKFVSL